MVAITLLCYFAWRRGQLSLKYLLIVFFVVLLLLSFQDVILNRLLGDDDGSAESRLPLIKIAFKIIGDYPVFGVGANNFSMVIEQYITPEFSDAWIAIIHNKYLLVWVETGIFGLVTFVWFLFGTIISGLYIWKAHDHFLSPLALGFIAAILGQMVHMFVNPFNTHNRPLVQSIWLTAGLIAAMSNLIRVKSKIP